MEYYTIDRIMQHKCTYNILLGQRSNGKSYSVKKECVKEAFLGMGDLIYLRRWKLELKQEDVIDYFRDCPTEEITGGEFNHIDVYRGRIYLANINEAGEVTRGRSIGRTADLAGAAHLKSVIQRGIYKNIIYEEFCTDSGYLSGGREPNKLMQFVATVFGVQYTGRVWMIGNTVSRYNPYFYCWQLKTLQKMKPGDIDIYRYTDGDSEVSIAVEFCSSLNVANNMFIGDAKANITTGVWETTSQPMVPEEFGKFKVVYRMAVEYQDFRFILKVIKNKASEMLLLCVNDPDEKARRVVSDRISGDIMTTTKMLPLTRGDEIILSLIKRGKMVYANNLVGTDFQSILKNVAI